MSIQPTKLLLVDDNRRLTSAWERLISQQPDLKLVATLDRADGLVAVVRDFEVDVILMDLTMEGRNPLEAVAEVTRECPNVRTFIYSAHNPSEWRERARQAGAVDVLDKADDPASILATIRMVSSKRTPSC